jgi:hypothetical protein
MDWSSYNLAAYSHSNFKSQTTLESKFASVLSKVRVRWGGKAARGSDRGTRWPHIVRSQHVPSNALKARVTSIESWFRLSRRWRPWMGRRSMARQNPGDANPFH